jgi:hypothetical protein
VTETAEVKQKSWVKLDSLRATDPREFTRRRNGQFTQTADTLGNAQREQEIASVKGNCEEQKRNLPIFTSSLASIASSRLSRICAGAFVAFLEGRSLLFWKGHSVASHLQNSVESCAFSEWSLRALGIDIDSDPGSRLSQIDDFAFAHYPLP